jgi:DNA (cytosine-5)-methyltransferase 1
MKPMWFSEIEPFPCALLAHRYPSVANLGDMNYLPALIRAGLIQAPKILVGGTPCQAFSVAGKGESLDDDRGQLTLTYVDVLNAIDEQRPNDEAICVWENVPGVLSTKDNAFGCFLGALSGSDCELQYPGKKWSNSGCVYGPQRTVAWRVINAQHFGVAQRRKRVFVVASARKGFDPCEVLFESEGVRRDTAPSREAKQEITNCITAGIGNADRDAQTGNLVTLFEQRSADGVPRISPDSSLCPTLNTMQGGQREPCVVLPIHDKATRHAGVTGKGSGNGLGVGIDGAPCPTLTCGDKHAVAYTDISHCLNAGGMGRNDYETETWLTNTMGVRKLTPVECERLQGFPDNHTLLPYGSRQKLDNEMREYYSRHLGRELTIDEQRLMCGDGPRYKAIGNSKAVPCIKWIGERIIKHLTQLSAK